MRVRPGFLETCAGRLDGRLKSAFRRLDFPTFDRPRKHTSGCEAEGMERKCGVDHRIGAEEACVKKWFA